MAHKLQLALCKNLGRSCTNSKRIGVVRWLEQRRLLEEVSSFPHCEPQTRRLIYALAAFSQPFCTSFSVSLSLFLDRRAIHEGEQQLSVLSSEILIENPPLCRLTRQTSPSRSNIHSPFSALPFFSNLVNLVKNYPFLFFSFSSIHR